MNIIETITQRRHIMIATLLAVLVLSVVVGAVLSKSESVEVSETLEQTTPIVVTGTICIDAGHGGSDTGAISLDDTTLEKDDTLELALSVQRHLEALNLSVVMTRTDDSTVDLNERCKIANTTNADLFVSLHRNSSTDEDANGVEVWIHSSQPPIDTALANNILNGLASVGIQSNRGVSVGYRGDDSEDYRINRLTTMPSCLVETGFISNATDMELYSTHLDDYAQAIAEAIYKTLEDIQLGLVDTSRGKSGQNWNGFQN
jgi:N-acetylmuramoyl-L-alanine amidase